MGADVEAGQPDQGDGGQGKGAARRAEPGQGGGAQGDGDGRVPGQVPEPGGFTAAAAESQAAAPPAVAGAPCASTTFESAQVPVPPTEEPGGQLAVSG